MMVFLLASLKNQPKKSTPMTDPYCSCDPEALPFERSLLEGQNLGTGGLEPSSALVWAVHADGVNAVDGSNMKPNQQHWQSEEF